MANPNTASKPRVAINTSTGNRQAGALELLDDAVRKLDEGDEFGMYLIFMAIQHVADRYYSCPSDRLH